MGAEISAERSDKGIEDDLHKIIGVCDACFKDTANAGQIEEVLNGIVSMLALVTGEKSENLIVAFCEKLTKAPSNIIGMTCLKVLWSLYQSLDTESPMRFHVYHALVILAGRTKLPPPRLQGVLRAGQSTQVGNGPLLHPGGREGRHLV